MLRISIGIFLFYYQQLQFGSNRIIPNIKACEKNDDLLSSDNRWVLITILIFCTCYGNSKLFRHVTFYAKPNNLKHLCLF